MRFLARQADRLTRCVLVSVEEVLLGLQNYELHNELDHHMELLLGGLVTNESLYLRLADY